MAVVALLLGMIGLALVWLPVVDLTGMLLGAVAAGSGVVGAVRVCTRHATNLATAVSATVLGVLVVGLGISDVACTNPVTGGMYACTATTTASSAPSPLDVAKAAAVQGGVANSS